MITKPEAEAWIVQDAGDRNVWHWHYELPGPMGIPRYSANGTGRNEVEAQIDLDAAKAEGDRRWCEELRNLGL